MGGCRSGLSLERGRLGRCDVWHLACGEEREGGGGEKVRSRERGKLIGKTTRRRRTWGISGKYRSSILAASIVHDCSGNEYRIIIGEL